MRWGDYWRGLNECLPADVTLAQLDNAIPQWQAGVNESVRSLAGRRKAWTTLWLEGDGGPIGHAKRPWRIGDDQCEGMASLGEVPE